MIHSVLAINCYSFCQGKTGKDLPIIRTQLDDQLRSLTLAETPHFLMELKKTSI